jgi:cytoskeletal protein CcmA (bactofilin family)
MAQSSIIGADTVVRGNVSGQGSLEILGRVEGDVNVSGDVIVGDAGAVLGSVEATKISVAGAVQGDLRGKEAVLVERGGKVLGDLSAPRIGIADGGLVRGHVRTENDAGQAAPARRAAAPSPAAPSPAVRPLGLQPPKPVAKVEPARAPAALGYAEAADDKGDDSDVEAESEHPTPRPAAKEPEVAREAAAPRRPPPPVLPSLGKGVKATKKKGHDS